MFLKLKSKAIRFFEKGISSASTQLKVGDKAPEFSLPDEMGKLFLLSRMRGKKVALYFYPKDHTMGCTMQSCNLRDHYHELILHGIEVVGISTDDSLSHQKFKSDFKLPFRLLSDKDKKVVNLYGVYGRKNLLGLKFQGIIRTTFVIDEGGLIEKVITSVDAANHSTQILE
jgi:peroxiredoxin Q/BCP